MLHVFLNSAEIVNEISSGLQEWQKMLVLCYLWQINSL